MSTTISLRPVLGSRIGCGPSSGSHRGRLRSSRPRCERVSTVETVKTTAKPVTVTVTVPWELLQPDTHRTTIIPGHVQDWEASSRDLHFRPPISVAAGAGSFPEHAHWGLTVFSVIEKLVDKVFKRPVRRLSNDPEIQLCGNFAPVNECPPVRGLKVVGRLPKCLDGGVYLRNGPNPRILPEFGYNFFDGDGMLHAVSFKDDGATYACRFVETNKFQQEHNVGRPLFVNPFGEGQGMRGFLLLAFQLLKGQLGILDTSHGFGPANAGLVFHDGKLLAISEMDVPYSVRVGEDGDIFTLGRHTFDGKLKLSMTAHPKIDPQTGEMFCYTYDLLIPPYLKYFWVSADGVKQPDVRIKCPGPVLVHDFAITNNYTIFPETGIGFSVLEMMKGSPCIAADDNKLPRFGVLPKYAKDDSQIKWFSLPNANSFHYYNAWEEGEEVVICASVVLPVSKAFVNPEEVITKPSEIRLNMRTGEVSLLQITDVDLDLGTINEKFRGRKNRYAYLSIAGPWLKCAGIAKLDLQAPKYSPPTHQQQQVSSKPLGDSAIVGWRKVPGCFNSEPWFVPRTTDRDAAEDDGYVLAFSHNEITNQTELLVLDAQSPTLRQVARVKIPSRVPYGFHGIFLSKQEVAQL